MNIDISKFERQKLGAERWRNAGGIGTLNWVPRFGKTYGAITFIINPHLEKKSDNTIKIVVPSEIIAKQWIDNLQSYGKHHNRIEVYTANAVLNNSFDLLNCSLLIIDEIHKFTSKERLLIIDGTRIKSKYRLGLTGTYPTDNATILELYPIVDTISELEAVEKNWISNCIEFNVLLQLSDKDKVKYKAYSIPIQETLELFRSKSLFFDKNIIKDDYTLIEACYRGIAVKKANGSSSYIKYDSLCNALGVLMKWSPNLDLTDDNNKQLNYCWNPTLIHDRAKKFINDVRKRNEIIIDNPIKMYAIGEILKISKKTTICFNESTNFADAIANYVNALFNFKFPAISYHSKLESKSLCDPNTNMPYVYTSGKRKGDPRIFGKTLIKRYVIDYTNSGYFQFLSTAKALDEGLDIPRLEQVICTGGTINPINYDQRVARGKTINIYNPNKTTLIFNLVFDDFIDTDGITVIHSRDKAKLIARQISHSDQIIWTKSISEINFNELL